jgi:hypothetical protein
MQNLLVILAFIQPSKIQRVRSVPKKHQLFYVLHKAAHLETHPSSVVGCEKSLFYQAIKRFHKSLLQSMTRVRWFISQVELAETQLEPAADHLSHQVIFFFFWGSPEGGDQF